MNSPFVLVLFIMVLLAYPIYALNRDASRAKQRAAEIRSKGFTPTHSFNLSDTIIELDLNKNEVSFVNLDIQIFRKGQNSFNARMSQIISIDVIESIRAIQLDHAFVSIDITFNPIAANTFNSNKVLNFFVHQSHQKDIQKILDIWPNRAAVSSIEIQ